MSMNLQPVDYYNRDIEFNIVLNDVFESYMNKLGYSQSSIEKNLSYGYKAYLMDEITKMYNEDKKNILDNLKTNLMNSSIQSYDHYKNLHLERIEWKKARYDELFNYRNNPIEFYGKLTEDELDCLGY
jgi:hypothetical protein